MSNTQFLEDPLLEGCQKKIRNSEIDKRKKIRQKNLIQQKCIKCPKQRENGAFLREETTNFPKGKNGVRAHNCEHKMKEGFKMEGSCAISA